MVARTRHSVTLYVLCLSCYKLTWFVNSSTPVTKQKVNTVFITGVYSARDSCLFQNVQTDSYRHDTSCSICTGFRPRQQSGRGLKLTTHRHLVAMLKMSGLTRRLPYRPSRRGQVKILRLPLPLLGPIFSHTNPVSGLFHGLEPGYRDCSLPWFASFLAVSIGTDVN
jgi:hypothetical protein